MPLFPPGRRASAVGGPGETTTAGGLRALRPAARVGRKVQLGAGQLRRVERGLKRGPEALRYTSGLWTSARVQQLIESECGVRYHPGHVWRILRQLGWSCQRPTGRAREGDEAAVRRRKQERWPELKKNPQRGPNHSGCGRKRVERAPASPPHLGSEGLDTGAAASLQLEDAAGHGRGELVEFLFSNVPRRDSQPAGDRIPNPFCCVICPLDC